MNNFIIALVGTGLAGLALVLVATAVAWREHHLRVQHLRRQRVHSANSHFALLAKTQAVDEQLLAVTTALEQEQTVQADPSEQAQRQSTLHSAMQRMTGDTGAAHATRGTSHGARRQSDVAVAGDGAGTGTGSRSKHPPSGRPRLPRALLNAAAAASAQANNTKDSSAHWQETSPMVLANEPEHFDPTEPAPAGAAASYQRASVQAEALEQR